MAVESTSTPEWLQILAAMGSAGLGVVARANQWQDAGGKWNITKAVTEIVTAPCLGLIVWGGAQYFGAPLPAAFALASMAGLIGAPAFGMLGTKLVERYIQKV